MKSRAIATLLFLLALPLTALADNVAVTEGSGKTIGFDDISSVNYQRIKLLYGADGVNSGDVSTSNPFPIQLRTSGGTEAGTSGNPIQCSLANTSTNATSVNVAVTALVPGTGATNLGKAEDSAHSSGDTGVMSFAVRVDSAAAIAGADGDYSPLQVDASGALRVTGGGGGTEYTEDAAAASNPVGPILIVRRKDTLSGSEVSADGDNIAVNSTAKGEVYVKQTDAVPVTDNGGSLTVDGTVAATQSGTWNVTNISGTVSLPTGAATETTLGSLLTSSQLIDDTIATSGSAITTKGVAASGTDGTNARVLKTDSSGELQVDVLSSALPSGAATEATLSTLNGKVTACNTGAVTVSAALPAGTNAIGKLAANSGVDIGDVDVTSISAGNNNIGDVDANQNGTWTVQPGNTANTTPWLVSLRPSTSGGWDPYHLSSAGSTNATVVKSSAGQLGGWYIYNNTASMRKICFHNSTSTPTAGASVYFCLPLPAGPTAANALGDAGIAFSSGIAITTVTGIADSDNTAVSANDLNINLFYK